ncbi:hypothetical protein F4813DRAFT_385159 [Daldinia decipiens]|uniref:uncharacterized protein n=1 Tax=Daldinia decipiens TaxID=326647 RepID=UPI0020C42082|nr:uncharacterized protein F4813DRAFT_385159 [Daldinia decipiens]KAI1662445.1 hypothetical protein F4813DRAFT_385159 [Daldinia decipiens]
MTGDGVNDAPSLKKADDGIAVEGSSEAAQAAADTVFLAPGLSTIILSIKTSRQTCLSWQLVGAILGVDALATIFTLFGWLSGRGGGVIETTPHTSFANSHNGWTDIATVVVIWAYSIGVLIFIAIVYLALNSFSWINNLGRKDRNKKDTQIEDIIGHINKLAIEHELDPKTGRDKYLIVEKEAADEEDI